MVCRDYSLPFVLCRSSSFRYLFSRKPWKISSRPEIVDIAHMKGNVACQPPVPTYGHHAFEFVPSSF